MKLSHIPVNFLEFFVLAPFVSNSLGAATNSEPRRQVSIPDEDPLDAVLVDLDVLAEVKLPMKPSRFLPVIFCYY